MIFSTSDPSCCHISRVLKHMDGNKIKNEIVADVRFGSEVLVCILVRPKLV